VTEGSQDRPGDFDALLTYVRDARGFDFTGYKKPSLARRMDKRLQARKVAGYDEYRALLEKDPDEFVELFNTILINVTAFFRDEFAWDYLREVVVPRLLAARDDEQLRIWSTGCATGEEAFSLAIVFAEALGADDFKRRVKIYATDVDDDALRFGRHAMYSPKQIKPVPEELLKKYFARENHSYAFRGELRRTVIFGRHDLIQDPPISRIDLLVSRNTLMYFTPEVQSRVLANFNFALREDGYLLLGKSEALTAKTDLFKPVDLKRRVFAKVPKRAERTALPRDERATLLTPSVEAVVRDSGLDVVSVAFIAIDREGKLALANIQARMQFGLSQRDLGRPIQDLEISFRPVELRSRIEQAYTERHPVSLRDVAWRAAEETRYLDVQVSPLNSGTGECVGAGITFTDVTRYRRLQIALQEARREAETAGEELQATVEELETTNEELQATNEELETTNEELQATNEELETMNEELESTNEELETMNDELHQRGMELNTTNAFLEAILASLPAAIVVDRTLRVQAWNAGARELWGLTTDEAVGQHFMNLDIGLPVEKLHAPLRGVLADDDGNRDIVRLDATNRRGRAVTTRVELAALHTDGSTDGVILMMETEDAR
jgi:two-component system CheB/CheR fusion protein